MTVFKTFLKILRKNILLVIIFSILLVMFGALRTTSDDKTMSFSQVKPDITIINEDEEVGITKGLINYIKDNSNTPEIEIDEDSLNDALFYNDTDYVIYIPKNFNVDFMKGNIDNVKVKKGNNYNASFAEMLISRYLKLAVNYRSRITNQDELVRTIKTSLDNNTEIEIKTKLDTDSIEAAEFFFDFESYSLLINLIFIIGLMLSIFNEEKVKKRIIISSTDYKKNNRILLLSNLLYAFTLWLIYLILGIILIGDILWTSNGLLFILNSFIHLITLTSLAFLIGNLVKKKESVNGITNVIGIGTCFLCGVFVPLAYLPDSVTKIGHILPTYYYVEGNSYIAKLEEINMTTLQPILINMGVLIGSAILFIIISNIVSNKRRKIG
ncbi:MAG: ABC transporter permease [Bacilli bacterium]|nr:ABC transporter permease [Bacilli bacterium]